ncbi:similar to An12g02310 [Aspergillus luchuensis]|uniref:Similar to An12g02310 n=1 Tax=Aspergillus kawachii TaxID=1069201 RepID=A0A146FG54_ASPKA|nr:similar to An12g02310 [Aspergillus luchuensis]
MASSTYSHKPLFDTPLDFEFGAWKVGRFLSSKVREQEDPQEDCRSIPKLLGYAIERQVSSDELPGGYIAHIVMQKVTGENLHGFDTLPEEEQNRIRIAFIEGYGVDVL